MKSNKELAPRERIIYVYEKEGQEMAVARIGEKTFAGEVTRTEGVLTDDEWNKRKSHLIDRCMNSLSFFEQYGRPYDHAKDTNLAPKKRIYPIERLPYAQQEA